MLIGITDTVPSEIFRNLNSSFFAVLHKVDAVSGLERAKGTDDSSRRSTSFMSISQVKCIISNLSIVSVSFPRSLL